MEWNLICLFSVINIYNHPLALSFYASQSCIYFDLQSSICLIYPSHHSSILTIHTLPSINPSLHLSIHPSIHQSICPSIHPSILTPNLQKETSHKIFSNKLALLNSSYMYSASLCRKLTKFGI